METTNTIKGIEVIAYKGMNSDITCKGFHYEIGKSYKTDKAELCNCGFHACLNPLDVLEYYSEKRKSHYFKVKLSGEIAKCDKYDTQVAATEITILEEITDTFNEVIKTTEWWKSENVLDLLYWSDGFARVQREDDKWNFIDKNGNYLFNEWCEWVDDFKDGFARVQREDDKWNFIDKNGNYLFNEWCEWVDDFKEGFAVVQREDYLRNFIDKNGKILSDEWFSWADIFNNGFARVQRGNDLRNFIDTKGKILSDEWFSWADIFNKGFARVQRGNDLRNFIDTKGKILSDEWFSYVGYFDEYGLAIVQRTNGEWAKIDKTGNLIKILQ